MLKLQLELSTTEFYTAEQSDKYLSAAFEHLHVDRKNFDVSRLGPLNGTINISIFVQLVC